MKLIVFLLCCGLFGCALFSTQETPPPQPLPLHQKLPSFSLLNYQGQAISLNAFHLQKIPVVVFIRSFKQDQEWLQALKSKIKEFYLEGCVVFVVYPENQVTYEEIDAFKLPVHFLTDPQHKIAQKYHVFDSASEEPYFAIFTGDFAFRCQFQQAVKNSKEAIAPPQLLLGIVQQQQKSAPEAPKAK